MRISAKGRYALASVIHMAQQHHSGESVTLISISERLGISKIYLEQVFSLLKRGELVTSVKGALGGYLLSASPEQINVLDVLMKWIGERSYGIFLLHQAPLMWTGLLFEGRGAGCDRRVLDGRWPHG